VTIFIMVLFNKICLQASVEEQSILLASSILSNLSEAARFSVLGCITASSVASSPRCLLS
jgi:hypothetical protein